MDRERVAEELVQIAKDLSSADTFKCPDCGTKVLEQTGFCVKCKKKVKQAREMTSASLEIWAFSGGEMEVEFGYNPFENFLQIGMGGEWWAGKVKPGKNIFHHKKEKYDEGYKPVTVVVRQLGENISFDVAGGFGYEHNFIIKGK